MGTAIDMRSIPKYANHVLYDGQQMFKGQQDQRLRHMLKLGKSNIKYLGSGKQIPGPVPSSSYGLSGQSEHGHAS